ncbi:hypothetical protein [Neomoorella mulderi]|uniref:hypothetical protein n=1 Tax=Neomoorella mulderi TaxID=202604 RepID=UPI0013729F23|nr:hypothetical protein [Moorella mulderi]
MMVQQKSGHHQAPPLLRSERRKIELEKRQLQKKISRYNLPTTFDNHTVTRFANFGLIEPFKQAIGFKKIIRNTLTMRKAPNSKFQPTISLRKRVLGVFWLPCRKTPWQSYALSTSKYGKCALKQHHLGRYG